MTFTRRSLLASLGVALPVALTAVGAEAATPSSATHATHHHRPKKHHSHASNTHTHHHKPRHSTAAVKKPHAPQA